MEATAGGVEVSAVSREQRFLAFVDEHQDRAVRVAWRLTGGADTTAAEDIAQNAFLKAYRTLGRFREEASLATWYYRILVNEVRKYRRWRALRERWRGLWPADDSVATTVPGDPGLRRRIADALERLPSGQREVFVLVHIEEFTVEETARQLGKAVGTVKSHLHRALHTLRAELGDLRGPGSAEKEARENAKAG